MRWTLHRKRNVEPREPDEDDTEKRLREAVKRAEQASELLAQTERRGAVVDRHIRTQREIRRQNGFAAAILESLKVKP